LPVGTSDVPGQSTVKVFCPRCEDVYYPRSDFQCAIDGAFFGTTLPHLLLLTYPQLRPAAAGGGGVVAAAAAAAAVAAATADGASQQPQQQPAVYNPRVFGFKLHPSAYGAGAAARVPSVRARLATIAASVPSSAVVVAGAAGGQQPDGVVVGRG
jgi:casein kinase II subunit beta